MKRRTPNRVSIAIRWIATAAMLVQVRRETGWWTAGTLFLILIWMELHDIAEHIRVELDEATHGPDPV